MPKIKPRTPTSEQKVPIDHCVGHTLTPTILHEVRIMTGFAKAYWLPVTRDP